MRFEEGGGAGEQTQVHGCDLSEDGDGVPFWYSLGTFSSLFQKHVFVIQPNARNLQKIRKGFILTT